MNQVPSRKRHARAARTRVGFGDVPHLAPWIRPRRRDYAIAVLAFLMKDSPAWILPVITAAIIDLVVGGGPISQLVVLASIAVVVIAQNYPMNMLYVRTSSRATRTLAYELRESLTEHFQREALVTQQHRGSAVIQTKLVRDVENIELMIQQLLPIALSGVFSLIGALVILAFNVPLFLIVFAVVVPVGIGLVSMFRSRSREQNERFRSQVEEFASQVNVMTSMLPVVRAHAVESTATKWVTEPARELRDRGVALDWLNGRFGALAWLSFQVLGVASLVLAAALAILRIAPISAGQVVLVATYFAVIMGTAIALLNLLPSLAKGLESFRSIDRVLGSTDIEDYNGKKVVDEIAGKVELRDVTVVFDGEPTLRGINIVVPARQLVALVGPSGAGKSTVLNAILGLVTPTTGDVLYDDESSRGLDLRSVRKHIAYVPQESNILDGSLRENVALGLDPDDSRIELALRRANLAEMCESPHNLDQVIGRGGIRLSVGQRQRLAIARALYREPKILVLDEATSSLDLESERQIQVVLESIMHSMTVIVVAHRLSTITNADNIYFLAQGRVVEKGNHAELMAKHGKYFDMINGRKSA